ncbi:hypothetical protein H920_07804 [Fukomys damarensis]|uniref:Uncharacterized protein n=1 Tax=Fukomys damarensis TaxID=885580 RepID=A0A091DIB4_FUKDA|nr:hypothetical protein H920_07804 [Fukomys damarensis]
MSPVNQWGGNAPMLGNICTQLCLPAPGEELERTSDQDKEDKKVVKEVSLHGDDNIWT